MQTIAPKRIRIDAVREADDSWTLVHVEDFDANMVEARDNALRVFDSITLPDAQAVPQGKTGIKVVYSRLSRERMGNIICGEFLQWASMGNMPLRDLLMCSLAAGRGVE